MTTKDDAILDWQRRLAAVIDERDELRARIEQQVVEILRLSAEVERHERRFRETEAEWWDRFQVLEAEFERLRADVKDHETREQLMFEVARRLFGEDEAKRWLTVVFEAYRELANHKE